MYMTRDERAKKKKTIIKLLRKEKPTFNIHVRKNCLARNVIEVKIERNIK